MNNRIVFWVIIFAIGVGLIVFSQVFRDKPGTAVNFPSPTPTASPDVSKIPSPTYSNAIVPNLPPATCQISGKIRFIDKDLYETIGAKISYQNIDDVIRQIIWRPNPDDGVLAIGPNLFEQLPIPNGEKAVGAALRENPTSDVYTLTAVVTYGIKLPSGAVEEKEAVCSGIITVEMP